MSKRRFRRLVDVSSLFNHAGIWRRRTFPTRTFSTGRPEEVIRGSFVCCIAQVRKGLMATSAFWLLISGRLGQRGLRALWKFDPSQTATIISFIEFHQFKALRYAKSSASSFRPKVREAHRDVKLPHIYSNNTSSCVLFIRAEEVKASMNIKRSLEQMLLRKSHQVNLSTVRSKYRFSRKTAR